MPRELIKSQVGPYHIRVGWSAYQDVQLGVELEDLVRDDEEPRPSIFSYLIGAEQREELARRVSEIVESRPREQDRTVIIAPSQGLAERKMEELRSPKHRTILVYSKSHLDRVRGLQLDPTDVTIIDGSPDEWVEVVAMCIRPGNGPHRSTGDAIVDAINEVTHGGYLGLWSDLDRHGINQLIKVLRRARDSAYGKDE
jgi:hypothetical protein